jgi:hypothetical protein
MKTRLHITAQTRNGVRVDLFYYSINQAKYFNKDSGLTNYQIVGLEK